MSGLKKILKTRLKGAKRIALIGVGSELRGDDAAGILVAEELKDCCAKAKGAVKFKAYVGATAPENLTGEIKKFKPTHIIITDTAEIREKPGTILILKPEEVGEGISFSTHKMPILVMIKYFQKSFKCDAVIIAIQPKTVEFGKPVSNSVKGAVREIAASIKTAVLP